MKKILDILKWHPKEEYNFEIPETNSNEDNKIKESKIQEKDDTNVPAEPKKIFPSLDINLEYMRF